MPSIRWPAILFSIGLTLAALAGLWLARPSLTPLTASDIEQARFDVAAPLPRESVRVGQSFVPVHNGLSSIELLAVVYPDGTLTETLTLRLLDAQGVEVAARTFNNPWKHNDPLRLTFVPQPYSAGQTYTLWLAGSAHNQISAWAYSRDGYAQGTLQVEAAPATGDLRFATTYTYLWPDIVRDAFIGLGRVAWRVPALWLLLFAPGQLVLEFLFPKHHWPLSFWARAGLALALSLSLMPLAWLWISVVGLHWSALALSLLYVLIGLTVMARAFYHLYTRRAVAKPPVGTVHTFHLPHPVRRRSRRGCPGLSIFHLALPLIILLCLFARLLATRDLAAPLWVDSSHHLLIARLLAETGHIPANYQPLMPVDRFYYHWGYHVLLVGAHWLTRLDWPGLMLLLGQVLNALMPLAVYAGTELLTGRPRAGLLAAFLVGLVSFFPGYYVSWGRYTQLVGLLVLAPLLGALWQMLRPENHGVAIQPHPGRWQMIFGSSILMAGLILTHYRVLAFLVAYALVALALGRRGGWKWLGLAAFVSGLLTLPWLAQLFQQAALPVLATPARLISPGGYNAFPSDYFRGDLERGWLTLAAVAVGWGFLRRERTMWVLGGWAVVTYALLNIGPGTWVVNNNAWAISLFLPAAMALGWGADQYCRLANRLTTPTVPNSSLTETVEAPQPSLKLFWERRRWTVGLVLLSLFVGLLVYAGVRGLFVQAGIVNPATRLVTADDMDALNWVAQNTPSDSVFAINGWKWLSNAWAGSDGGAWLWPLTGRRTTVPPLDYTYERDWLLAINAFNERLATQADANAPGMLELLNEMNVTHVFIGAKGGSLKPEMFLDSPRYRLLYTNGAAWVFELVRP